VAEDSGKRHDNILLNIREVLEGSLDFRSRNWFRRVDYTNEQGRTYPSYRAGRPNVTDRCHGRMDRVVRATVAQTYSGKGGPNRSGVAPVWYADRARSRDATRRVVDGDGCTLRRPLLPAQFWLHPNL
jgi:hypothetical protein